jgi:O-antigen/teichoic acid export membrane protein
MDPIEIQPIMTSRVRRIGRTGLTTGLAKVILLVGILATAPLVERHLGNERLGVWLTLVTFSSLLTFADLGLGNGIMTDVATASGSTQPERARKAVANGFVLLSASAAVIIVLAITWLSHSDVAGVFGVKTPAFKSDVSAAVTAFVVLFAIGLPLVTIEKAQWGLQRGYIPSSWLLASGVTTLAALIAIVSNGGRLMHLAIAFAGIPVLFSAANTLWSLLGPFSFLRPRRHDPTLTDSLRLLRTGSLYLILQVAVALAFFTDNLIVANFLGAEAVSGLAIPARMFAAVGFTLGLFLMPLWPEYANAIGRKETLWARNTALLSMRLATVLSVVLGGLIAGVAYLFAPMFGAQERPTWALLLALGLWTFVTVLGTTVSVFLNALGKMRFQVWASLVMVGAVLSLKVAFVQRSGIEGVVWAGVMGYTAVMGPALLWYIPRLLRELGAVTKHDSSV